MSLVDALHQMGLEAEVAMDGKWVQIEGERCSVYVVELSRKRGFFTWCNDPDERAVEYHSDPFDAIHSGLRRAARKGGGGETPT
jgi:hypothetical protein